MVRKWWCGAGAVASAVAILGAPLASAQALNAPVWQRQLGSAADEQALAVASVGDAVYVAGHTGGQFGEAPAAGGQDVFVVKQGTDGKVHWVHQVGTAMNDRALAVTADAAGNVYVAGYTWGSFLPYVNKGGTDFFVLKLSASGVLQWVWQDGTQTDDFATGLAVTRTSGQDGLFLAGYSLGRIDGTPTPGNYDVVVAKLDTGGNPYWMRQFGSSRGDVALGVAVSSREEIYLAGYTQGSLDGVTSTNNTVDLFLAKYDVAGNQAWVRQLGSNSDDYATGVAVDASGAAYVSGYTFGALDGNVRVGTYDAVLVKYDEAGDKQWTRQLGTTTTDYAQGVAVGADGRVHLVGHTSGALDGNVVLGGSDVFVSSYDTAGKPLGTRQVGSSASDRGQAVTVGADGGVYVVGYSWGSLPGNVNAGGFDATVFRF
ncbi:SBBP repeat-containing protein [Myxococcus sp. MISCRS1]|uniref:SBBP repeat-containing protein n=1 Tax=unclassified Myxococcus TaxID=2648731 RepID=UPI001CBE86C0|nr:MULTISPECIES: SBBP repeat-containing protein [unclassified Myxococcus]MBZ4394899.1 SBBP repeat-containing protein [Myxococcus sp. AS-1-15]MBZ4406682.1 SBBP repeat-containing protein [Myxococcus sp. XM-1-1-1]MCY1001878.1 SBBP repeat-containing protein [Myxococcus sp. MISCRS1]BDT36557.1 SBBP repeat-containing protein [Myxococcus sp. MH1]